MVSFRELADDFYFTTFTRDGNLHVGSQLMETAFPDRMTEAASDPIPADVLIVEDDPMIALGFEETILGFGVKSVRTASSVAKALEMIDGRAPDFALLNIGLMSEKTFAVAERLEALEIPFGFVTGYDSDGGLPGAFASRPRLPKPCPSDALEALLRGRAGRGPPNR